MFDTEVSFDLLEPSVREPDVEPVGDPLVSDLEAVPTGVMLGAALERIDRERLSGHDRVSVLKARARQISHLQAELYADIESVNSFLAEEDWIQGEKDLFQTTATEVRAALCLTRRGADITVDLALDLRERLPAVWEALDGGRIDLPRARVLADHTTHLPTQLARQVCEQALEKAPEQTTGQLRARLARLIIEADPAAAKERYEEKLVERKVTVEATDAGTANLCGWDLHPADANAAMRRINRKAKRLKAKGDKRPIDQIRADLYLDILNGRDQELGKDPGVVDIRVDLTTLVGLDDKPAEIPGWGPVVADIARQVVDRQTKSEWRAVITNQGLPLEVVTTRRRPNRLQQRLIEASQTSCVFPTCRMPSGECDLNHNIPWAQTHHTSTHELEPLCRHDHNNHHNRGWKLELIEPGVYKWTSPLGHTYTTRPEPP